MPNPKGKNGSGTKECECPSTVYLKFINIDGTDPPDDVLKDKLLLYAKRGYSVTEKLSRLESDLQLFIKYSHQLLNAYHY
jgi:hypothetical protein